MTARFTERAHANIALAIVAVALALMLASPLAAGAQGAADQGDSVAAPVAVSTEAASVRIASLPETGAGGTDDADVALAASFTTVTVLVLAGLAVLDRKPEVE